MLEVEDELTTGLTQLNTRLYGWWRIAVSGKDEAEVRAAREGATEALALMVERARAAGALRDDASHEDLRLVFCALRELAGIGPDAAHRLAELALRGIRA